MHRAPEGECAGDHQLSLQELFAVNVKSVTSFLLLLGCASLRAQDADRAPEYQFPVPDSYHASPGTPVIIRPGPALDARSISGDVFTVSGGVSGPHRGSAVLGDDGRTVVFTPSKPFTPGERVTVVLAATLRAADGSALPGHTLDFTVGIPSPNAAAIVRGIEGLGTIPEGGVSGRKQGGAALQSLSPPDDFPAINVIVNDAPSQGELFLSNFPFNAAITNAPYLMALESSGAPRFFQKLAGRGFDFKVQPNGMLSYFDEVAGSFYLLDSTYAIIDTFHCQGYPTDLHEFKLLPNGHGLLIGYDIQVVDMSKLVQGGDTAASVTAIVIQELDAAKNVVFEWTSWDHFNITDATQEDMTASVIDYVHTNAIEPDQDGNLLISSRNMDEITKIDRATGEIIWRFGGKHNQFTFANDTIGFSHQHDIRRLENGHVTMFDNGNFHNPPFSRALEYQLDDTAKTATLVWQFRHTPDVVSPAMGNTQRLANGNTVIGWGATNPTTTEVTPEGKIVYEMSLPDGVFSYRSLRLPAPEPVVAGVAIAGPREEKGAAVSVTPNPSVGTALLDLRIGTPAHVRATLTDMTGAAVATIMDGQMEAGEHRLPIDLSTVPTGFYLCRVATPSGVSMQPLVVAR